MRDRAAGFSGRGARSLATGAGAGRPGGRRRCPPAARAAPGPREAAAGTAQVVYVPAPPGGGLAGLGLLAVASAGFLGGTFLWTARPALRAFERACRDISDASEAAERSAEEVEKVSLLLQEELPASLESVERAGEEMEELGKDLRTLSLSIRQVAQQPVEGISDVSQAVLSQAADLYENSVLQLSGEAREVGMNVGMELVDKWRDVFQTSVTELRKRYDNVTVQRNQGDAKEWVNAWKERSAELGPAREAAGERAPDRELERAEMKVADALAAAENALARAELTGESAIASADKATKELQRAMADLEELQSYEEVEREEANVDRG